MFRALIILAFSALAMTARIPLPCPECFVHKEQMTMTKVPFMYGKPVVSADYSKARSMLFPNALEKCVFGGCEPRREKFGFLAESGG